jgi:hypothetical protein
MASRHTIEQQILSGKAPTARPTVSSRSDMQSMIENDFEDGPPASLNSAYQFSCAFQRTAMSKLIFINWQWPRKTKAKTSTVKDHGICAGVACRAIVLVQRRNFEKNITPESRCVSFYYFVNFCVFSCPQGVLADYEEAKQINASNMMMERMRHDRLLSKTVTGS